MSIGHFIGRRVADVVHFFRGRQAVPCTVDWETARLAPTTNQLSEAIDITAYLIPGSLQWTEGGLVGQFDLPKGTIPESTNSLSVYAEEPCCGKCDNGCWEP